jgi:hypothetical protein
MDTHICLLFDGEDAIIKTTTIVTAKNSEDARAKAHALLNDTPGASGFELWLNGDRVYVHLADRNKKPSR